MAIELQESFEVDVGVEGVRAFLTDPRRLVPCIPSAELVGEADGRRFDAEIGFGFGPFGARILAHFRIDEPEAEERTVRLVGRATSDTPDAVAHIRLVSRLEPTGRGATRVRVTQSVDFDGSLAALSETAIARNVADMLLGRFVRCVRESLEPSRGHL